MSRATPVPETVTLHVPFRVVKRGGRKEIRLPEGTPQPRRTDSTLVKALARAFRWKRMLELEAVSCVEPRLVADAATWNRGDSAEPVAP